MLRKNPCISIKPSHEVDESRDQAISIYDYISQEKLATLSQALETCYIGYLVNKNNTSWANSDGQLIDKILEEDLKLENARPEFMGDKDIPLNDDVREHEFSISIIRAMADSLGSHLSEKLGSDWKDLLGESVKRELAHVSYSELATLKATSNVQSTDRVASTKTTIVRSKMAEKCMEELRTKDERQDGMVIRDLEKHLTYLENNHLCIDLFKKPQHGGIREIYVMNSRGRFIQALFERLARTVCNIRDMETMTDPKQKHIIPDRHYKISKDLLGRPGTSMLFSSDDRTRWNQRLSTKAFAIILCRILPAEFHPFIIRVLNCWPDKLILLPEGVQKHLISNSGTLNSSSRKFIQDCFTGQTRHPILGEGERLLNIRTGMMQGILHFTSSLFHAALLLLHKHLSVAAYKHIDPDMKLIISHMVSSDDSSSLITTNSSNPTRSKTVTCSLLRVNDIFGKFACIWTSPKSAGPTRNVVEFNSTWTICGSTFRPINKWVVASLTVPICSSLVSRQEQASNLLSSLLESGCPFYEVFCIQYSQALLHYQLLGSLTHSLFPLYIERISEIPDPNLGFFLMDHPIMPGLMGFEYNHFIAISRCPSLQHKYAKLIDGEYVEVTATGTILTAATLRFGPMHKHARFIDKCRPMFDWEQHLNENPLILYSQPRTVRDEQSVIMRKITSSGVLDTFSNSLAPIKAIASTAFLLTHHALRQRRAKFLLEEIPDEEKYSLLQMARIQTEERLPMTEGQFAWMFPSMLSYRKVQILAESIFTSSRCIVWPNHMKMHSTIIIPKVDFDSYANLESLCKWKWFGVNLRMHEGTLNIAWNNATASIPWLRSSADETLTASPFETHIELHDYLTKIRSKERRVHLISAPLRGRTSTTTIQQLIKRCQWPRRLLHYFEIPSESDLTDTSRMEDSSNESQTVLRGLETTSSRLYLASLLPLCQDEWERRAEMIIREAPSIPRHLLPKIRPKLVNLSLMGKFVRKEIVTENDKQEVRDHLEQIKDGICGRFTIRQKSKRSSTKEKPKYYGRGIWFGTISSLKVRLHFNDDSLVLIETTDAAALSLRTKALQHLINEIGLTRTVMDELPSRTYYFDLKNINFSTQKVRACRVQVCQLNENPYLDFDIVKLDFHRRNPLIRSVVSFRSSAGKNIDLTILNYMPKSGDFHSISQKEVKRYSGFTEAWIKQGTISFRTFWNFVKNVSASASSGAYITGELASVFNDSLKSWLASLIQRALKSKGYHIAQDLQIFSFSHSQTSTEIQTVSEMPTTQVFTLTEEERNSVLKWFDQPDQEMEPETDPMMETEEQDIGPSDFAWTELDTLSSMFDTEFTRTTLQGSTGIINIHPIFEGPIFSGELSSVWFTTVMSGLEPESQKELASALRTLLNIPLSKTAVENLDWADEMGY